MTVIVRSPWIDAFGAIGDGGAAGAVGAAGWMRNTPLAGAVSTASQVSTSPPRWLANVTAALSTAFGFPFQPAAIACT